MLKKNCRIWLEFPMSKAVNRTAGGLHGLIKNSLSLRRRRAACRKAHDNMFCTGYRWSVCICGLHGLVKLICLIHKLASLLQALKGSVKHEIWKVCCIMIESNTDDQAVICSQLEWDLRHSKAALVTAAGWNPRAGNSSGWVMSSNRGQMMIWSDYPICALKAGK